MFALRIEFLTGRAVSTEFHDRRSAEWPPHPARIFSALTDAWADADEPSPEERAALLWLQTLPAPEITASEAAPRSVVTHFVPVNDPSVVPPSIVERAETAAAELQEAEADLTAAERDGAAGRALNSARKRVERARDRAGKTDADLRRALSAESAVTPTKDDLKLAPALLPTGRVRQPRTFPSVTPEDPVVHYRWAEAPETRVRTALAGLCRRVVRIGHSSSLVRCTIVDTAPQPTLAPNPRGDRVIRVTREDQLERLEEEYQRHLGVEPRVLPCRFERYGKPAAEPPQASATQFRDDWIVLQRASGPTLPTTRGVELAKAVRDSLLSHGDQPPPAWISGHLPDGGPSASIHLAVVPLPFVGARHADGGIRGVALIRPRGISAEDERALLRALGRWEEEVRRDDEEHPVLPAKLGRAGVVGLCLLDWERPLHSLRPETWCGPASIWETATPIALDRNPGDLRAANPEKAAAAWRAAEESIALACTRIGLPTPKEVVALPAAPLIGAAKARLFPPYPPEPGKVRRVKLHARVTFAAPVLGPVLLGAGRYFGLGLLRPVGNGRHA